MIALQQSLVGLQEILMPIQQVLALLLQSPQVLLHVLYLALHAPGVQRGSEAAGQQDGEHNQDAEGRCTHQHPHHIGGVLQAKEFEPLSVHILAQEQDQRQAEDAEHDIEEQIP